VCLFVRGFCCFYFARVYSAECYLINSIFDFPSNPSAGCHIAMFLFLHLGRDLSVHSVLAFVSRASAFHLVWPMQILKFNFAGNFNCVKGQPKVGGNMNYEHPQKYAQQHPFWLAAISYFIPRFIIKFFFPPILAISSKCSLLPAALSFPSRKLAQK